MWGISWMVSLLNLSESMSLEEQTEVVEAFAEIYPIEL
jgi:predicted 3-demethylubiquinone-9 3-methyltransferase (glyoxalase superfamily)